MASVMFRLAKIRSQARPVLVVSIRSASSDVAEVDEKKFPKVQSDLNNIRRGTGGRSSFNGKVATVFGAGGLLGRSIVNQLGKTGTQVVIPYRTDPYNILRLKLCGDLGQILFTPFFLNDTDSLYKSMKHSNIVINCIGMNHPTPNYTLEQCNVEGARNIARIAKECGAETLVHVSALNACENPKPVVSKKGSQFYSTKWRGEQAVKEEFPEAIIFRPSDMWGQQDTFLHYFMSHIRRTVRMMSLWNRGEGTIKQPVYYSDVAKGIMRAIADPQAAGHIFQAVGPHRYEMSELMDWFHRITNRTRESGYYRIDLRLDPTFWTRLFFSEMLLTRYRRISWGRLEREAVTDVVSPDLPTLEDLGVELTEIETKIFYELKPYRMHAYRDPLLAEYVRPVEPCPLARG